MQGSDRWRQERLHSLKLERDGSSSSRFSLLVRARRNNLHRGKISPAVQGLGVLRSSVGGNRKHTGLGCGGRSRRQRFIGKYDDGQFVSFEQNPGFASFNWWRALTSPRGLCSASVCHELYNVSRSHTSRAGSERKSWHGMSLEECRVWPLWPI